MIVIGGEANPVTDLCLSTKVSSGETLCTEGFVHLFERESLRLRHLQRILKVRILPCTFCQG